MIVTLDMDKFPDGVINWRDHVEKSKNPSIIADLPELDSNSAVQATPRAILSGNKSKQDIEEDSSSDEMLADVSVGQTNRSNRKGIYDGIIAKWTGPGVHASTEDGGSSDSDHDSHYSEDDIIDDSELLKRFETRSLAPACDNGYCIVSGDGQESIPPVKGHTHHNGRTRDHCAFPDDQPSKKGRTDQTGVVIEGSIRSPANQFCDPSRAKGRTSGSSTPKDPQRASSKPAAKKIAQTRPAADGKKKQPAARGPGKAHTFDQLPTSPPPSAVSPPPMPAPPLRVPGEGRKKAQATVLPGYL